MALVSGQLVRSRRFDLDRHRGSAIERGPQDAAPVDRRPGAPRRVVQLERRVTLAPAATAPIPSRPAGPRRWAARRARRRHRWAVGEAGARAAPDSDRRREAPRWIAFSVPRTRPRRSGTSAARRRGPTGTATAIPRTRRRARSRSESRRRTGKRTPSRASAARSFPASAVNGKRGELTPTTVSPTVAVALFPGGQIGEGADAGQMRNVDELDEQRPAGADPLDGAGLRADPRRARREGRHGDVLRLRSHGAGILLASPGGRTRRTRDAEDLGPDRGSPRSVGTSFATPSTGAGRRESSAARSWRAIRASTGMRCGRSPRSRRRPPTPLPSGPSCGAMRPRSATTSRSGTASSRRREAASPTPPPRRPRSACVRGRNRDHRAAVTTCWQALVTLYAVESGQPEISRTKRQGLVGRYGFADGPRHGLFPPPRAPRRRARGRGPRADRRAGRRRRRGRARGRRGGRPAGQLAAARRRLAGRARCALARPGHRDRPRPDRRRRDRHRLRLRLQRADRRRSVDLRERRRRAGAWRRRRPGAWRRRRQAVASTGGDGEGDRRRPAGQRPRRARLRQGRSRSPAGDLEWHRRRRADGLWHRPHDRGRHTRR